MTTFTATSTLDAGVYFDCCHGYHNNLRVVELANEHGADIQCDSSNPEDLGFAVDEAERFLNRLTPDHYYFGTNECGDWGVFPVEEE